MNDKENRKMAVSDLIKSAKIHTQEELMQALQARGVEVAQATLSRYIKELGAVKSSGPDGKSYYAIGSTPQVRAHISVDGIEISGQICVLRSQPGFASAIASVVDGAHLPGVMLPISSCRWKFSAGLMVTIWMAVMGSTPSETAIRTLLSR